MRLGDPTSLQTTEDTIKYLAIYSVAEYRALEIEHEEEPAEGFA
jgi:hypothetical protein